VKDSIVEELEINRFLIAILIYFLFSEQLSQPPFIIIIIIANFYCLQIDSKHFYSLGGYRSL